MGSPSFGEAPTYAGDSFSAILAAIITDVDTKRYTVTARTEGSGRMYPDLPIASFYAHHERGEGGYVLPDVGAPCWIATPGDSGTPFVLAFRSIPKAISSSERLDQAPEEGDEVMADHSMRRPRRLHGEFGWTTRDGSFLHYRKGGIVEIGSKASCQRLYIPLGNFIRDICENYGQFTAAGMQYFDGGRTEGSDGSDSESKWRLMVKARASDEMATVLVDAGIVDGKRFRIVVAPTSIRFGEETWETSGEKYHFFVDANGNVDEKSAAVVHECSSYALTVLGEKRETIHGSSYEVIHGDKVFDIAGPFFLTASGGLVLVGATSISPELSVSGPVSCSGLTIPGLGFPINPAFLVWVRNTHTHAIPPGAPVETGPPIGAP